jgi:hypothetical protein
MSSIATPADRSFPNSGNASAAEDAQPRAHVTRLKWAALQEAAGAVRLLAGLEPESRSPEIRDFPLIVQAAAGWRLEHAERGIDDLAAVMEHGLCALLSTRAQSGHAPAAALALWREFDAARAAILALAPPSHAEDAARLAKDIAADGAP